MQMPLGLRDQFDQLCEAKPTARIRTTYAARAALIRELDDASVKKLEFFGLGMVLLRAAPDIPYLDNPEDPGFKKDLLQVYASPKAQVRNRRERELSEQASTTLDIAVEPALQNGIDGLSDNAVRTVDALNDEASRRMQGRRQTGVIEQEELDYVRKKVLERLQVNIFGASRAVLGSLTNQVVGRPLQGISSKEFVQISPRLHTLLDDAGIARMVRRISGWDFHTFMTLQNNGLLTAEWLQTSPSKIAVNDRYVPNISALKSHRPSDNVKDKIVAGCPARHVRHLINWAPKALLQACDVVAEHDA